MARCNVADLATLPLASARRGYRNRLRVHNRSRLEIHRRLKSHRQAADSGAPAWLKQLTHHGTHVASPTRGLVSVRILSGVADR